MMIKSTLMLGRRSIGAAAFVVRGQQRQRQLLLQAFASSPLSTLTATRTTAETSSTAADLRNEPSSRGGGVLTTTPPKQRRASFASAAAAAAAATTAPSSTSNNKKCGGALLAEAAEENKHVDVVRYHHKNRKWSLGHVQFYSEALAIGLMENGFVPGDVVLSWLPERFSEQMVLQFACSKSGLILYTLDPSSAVVTDEKAPEKEVAAAKALAREQLSKALELTEANVFISQEAGDDVNYIELAQRVIPELRIFDASMGRPFVTPRFPHLRLCVQTGLDQDEAYGWYRYAHMIVPSDNLDTYVDVDSITSDTPLAGQFVFEDDDKGVLTGLGPVLTNEQVYLKENFWTTYTKIIQKEFHEVEGEGVIW